MISEDFFLLLSTEIDKKMLIPRTALEEVCKVTEQCLASVHQCLISKWMQARVYTLLKLGFKELQD